MRKKSKQISDLFKHYPYKKRHKKNIFRPLTKTWTYVEDHELSLNWSQWSTFMAIYFKHLFNFVISGRAVKLPNQMGIFRMYKYKYPSTHKAVDFDHLQKTGEIIYFQNNHTNGYGPIIKWHRKKHQGSFRRKWFWMIRFLDTSNARLAKEYKKDPSLLFSYDDPAKN
jgi:hypothetical protein